MTESSKDEVSKLTEAAATVTKGTSEAVHCQDGDLGHTTYTEALNKQFPASNPSMLSRIQVKERQVLIDKTHPQKPTTVSSLSMSW